MAIKSFPELLAQLEDVSDTEAILAAIPKSQEEVFEAIKTERTRRKTGEFCGKVRAILANDGNTKSIQEVFDLIEEQKNQYLKQ